MVRMWFLSDWFLSAEVRAYDLFGCGPAALGHLLLRVVDAHSPAITLDSSSKVTIIHDMEFAITCSLRVSLSGCFLVYRRRC